LFRISDFDIRIFRSVSIMDGFFQAVSEQRFHELLGGFAPLKRVETISLEEAQGRVLAEEVTAGEDLPLQDRVSMDGYAVRAADTFGASDANPVYLDIVGAVQIERQPEFTVNPGQCGSIVTGGLLPGGADAVIMEEYTYDMGGGTVEVRRSTAPGENVMLRGEDGRAGQALFPSGHRLRLQDVGLLAAFGHAQIQVFARPRVFIISTGNEVVDIRDEVRPGQVRDVNSIALALLVREAGGEPILGGRVPDDQERIREKLAEGLERADVILISGGSSVGVRDLTMAAIERLPSSSILAHGVMIKPGKPNILASVREKPVWGLPGQVTSAQVSVIVFGIPFLKGLGGEGESRWVRRTTAATMERNVSSAQGKSEYVRVRLEPSNTPIPKAVPVLGKSGLLRTLIQADGLVRIDARSEGLNPGELVEVWFL
jgi:molybdopterin molybdotransferase